MLTSDLAFTLNGNASTGVPDSGTTVLLLGCALIVLGLVSRGRVAATVKR